MASENLELTRSIFADWERGDYSSVEWADPDIELALRDGPEPGSWSGLDGLNQGWGNFLHAWSLFRVEPEEFREIDDERVLTFVHFVARGKASHLDIGEVRTRGASVFYFRSGKVTRMVLYFNADRAAADLGLPTEPRQGTSLRPPQT